VDVQEHPEFIDLVAQAVIDKIQERDQVNRIVELVVQRVTELQAQEATLNARKDRP